MLANVTAATSRFRRRLLLAAFVRATAQALFAQLVLATAALLVLRFVDASLLSAIGAWQLWTAIGAIAVACGANAAARCQPSDRFVLQHLEQRLSTDGLLLVAADGAELEPAWQQRLERQLARVPGVLPTLRWRQMLTRPLLAAGLLLLGNLLPQPEPETPPAEAAVVAAERLAEEAEEVAALPDVPEELGEELQEAARELQRRAEAGEPDLWRELDNLEERLKRERQLAGDTSPNTPSAEQMATALEQLGKLEGLDKALADVDDALREAIERAVDSDGSIDPDSLPRDPNKLRELADALAKHSEELANNDDLQRIAEDLGLDTAEKLAEQFAAIAEQLANEGDPSGESLANEDGQADEQMAEQLADELAQAAAQMAEMGALGELPEGLQELLAEAAARAAGSIDPETLRDLLPEDLEQLRELGELLQRMAQQAAGESPGGSAGEGMSEAQKQQLAQLAQRLQNSVQRGQRGGNQPGRRQSGGSQPGGRETGGGTEGGGHTVLRLTEDAHGGVSDNELELPSQPPTGELPDAWQPTKIDKAKPEVADPRTGTPAGRAGATGTGGATWQMRLRPRDREIVRRFFGKDKR